jgi:biopolymer transport protein ExbB
MPLPPLRLTPFRRAVLAALCVVALVGLFPSAVVAQEAAGEAAKPAAGSSELGFGKMAVHIVTSVGPFWCIMGPTSLILMGIVVWLLLDLRGSAAIPAGFVDEFTDTVNKRKFKEAFEMAKEDPSYLGRVLTAGMGRLQYGLEDAREAALNTLDSIKGSKERWNNYLAVIAALGPLLGLVGTVYGMIGAFKALGGGENKNPALLADSIAHALAVTLVGVAIAVPALALNTFFRNRINQVTMDVGHVADDLLTQMYHNSKKGAAVSPSTPAAPAAPVPAVSVATPPARG